ncbi:class I SAM-dependent methyltransferase [Mesorhizobium sp. B283B1A]|uniref:class I SAM-dependent methyltransferase n=1 Tax=Mesorhizobium TaxID=68287 RepID=UPI001CD13BC4|nr:MULTISPECIES: class I SAM-dependent methyltransferase [Mesorhizobium]MCA0048027.1 class I SAM-dependent methyltransferase [Mesorhizobium sp. B283B1A]UQS63838.1 class I SAM-dependent methyltransferase [Mesorhizobium opportunistum]
MRLFQKPRPALPPRTKKITSALNLAGKGIEYGPLHAVLLRKAHYDVSYVDYADRAYLAEHYANNPDVDVSLIPEIDIVTGGKLISEFLPEESIDYVVASHVMEHVPDLLGWLESNLRVLKLGGRIAVAFPDKRYCFDLKRKNSTISDVMAAYLEKRTKPSFQQICDHFWNVSKARAADCWKKSTTPDNAEYVHDRRTIVDTLRKMGAREDYIDCHCWVFPDFKFLETMNVIRSVHNVGFEVVSFYPTQPNTLEFYVTFEKI